MAGPTRLQRLKLRFINLYPPLLGAGIRVKHMAPDLRVIDVEMKLRLWNANYVGTHFGGSLYTMTDPFYMLMLMANLGPEYVVWDKAATIRFRRPGRGTVRAQFRLSEEQLEDIRARLRAQETYEPVFTIEVRDADGGVVAEVEKRIYVRLRSRRPA